MRRLPVFLVLFVGLVALAPSTALAAAGDVPGTPMALGATVSGAVDISTKACDVWSIDLSYGQEVLFDVSASDLLFVDVLRPTTSSVWAGGDHPAWEDIVADGDTGIWEPHSTSIAFTAAVSGTYFVCLGASDNGTTYSLSVKKTGASVSGPQLPDIYGVPIGIGTVDGVVERWTNEDAVYQVRLSENQPVAVTLQPMNSNYADAYSELALLSPSSQTVKSDAGYTILDLDTSELSIGTCGLQYTPAVTGLYFIRVTTADDLPYRLTVAGTAEKPLWRSRASLSSSKRVVRRGRTVMLTGVLYRQSTIELSDQSVTLSCSFNGRRWRDLATLSSTSATFAVPRRVRRTTWFRLQYEGSADCQSCMSRSVKVRVR